MYWILKDCFIFMSECVLNSIVNMDGHSMEGVLSAQKVPLRPLSRRLSLLLKTNGIRSTLIFTHEFQIYYPRKTNNIQSSSWLMDSGGSRRRGVGWREKSVCTPDEHSLVR